MHHERDDGELTRETCANRPECEPGGWTTFEIVATFDSRPPATGEPNSDEGAKARWFTLNIITLGTLNDILSKLL
jgi:hypothetical protein